MSKVDAGILGTGIGLVVVAVGAVWKSASMQGDTRKNYQQRTALAQAGLDEKAAADLRALAERVNKLLGDLDEFDPTHALADPAELQESVNSVQKTLSARRRVAAYYRGLLSVGPKALWTLLVATLSLFPTFAYFSGFTHNKFIGYIGLGISIASAVALTAITIYYIVLQQRFCKAELLADENVQ